jgi:predicted glutamine amidotransferase
MGGSDVCRWAAYYGHPVIIDELLFKTKHSLIDQSLRARMGVETTNGDGFGLGWYGDTETPAIYRSVSPAWSDRNLRELAGHTASRLWIAHIRAATGTAVQQTNCHPFRYDRWLFVHNGVIESFSRLRRDLILAVDPTLFESIEGSTDSEVLFHLALTFGLMDDPLPALERAVGFVEETARRHSVEHPLQMTLGLADGERLYAVRYSSVRDSRTLFCSAEAESLRRLYPDNPRLASITDEDRMVVSEPLVDLPGVWQEVPESTALIIQPGEDEMRGFEPSLPAMVS